MKIRKKDKVKIIAGKDKSREGTVEKVFPKKGKVLVSGINIYKKHAKATPGRPGGIVDVARPLAVSNLVLICPACGKPTRVGYKVTSDKKVRICKKCREVIDK